MDYGLSKQIPPADPRQEVWAKQREERGFDDTEMWALSNTIAAFIVPRLEVFKAQHIDHPQGLAFEEWDCVLQTMIDGFKEMEKYDNISEFKPEKVKKALTLFRKWFLDLWW